MLGWVEAPVLKSVRAGQGGSKQPRSMVRSGFMERGSLLPLFSRPWLLTGCGLSCCGWVGGCLGWLPGAMVRGTLTPPVPHLSTCPTPLRPTVGGASRAVLARGKRG